MNKRSMMTMVFGMSVAAAGAAATYSEPVEAAHWETFNSLGNDCFAIGDDCLVITLGDLEDGDNYQDCPDEPYPSSRQVMDFLWQANDPALWEYACLNMGKKLYIRGSGT